MTAHTGDLPALGSSARQQVNPLADLDTVEWPELHHAYGSAKDVPGQLRALRSPITEERRRAQGELSGNVYHQGTRWQASAAVVPFLVGLVEAPGTPERPVVLDLLRAVAIGDLDDGSLRFKPEERFAAADSMTGEHVAAVLRWLYREDESEESEEEDWPDFVDVADVLWARDAYLAAAGSADRFVAWVGDDDPAVAVQAAELLAWYPETDGAVPALLEVPANGDRAAVRVSANLTLAHLRDGDPRVDRRLRDLLDAEDYAVRLTAAVALAYRIGEGMPEPALDILLQARDRATELISIEIPWSRSLVGFASAALYRIGLG
ncbi:HEAT repeat domain-containing protein [Actinomadura alba]|uniref:HEAT repeat domain-containing protein n=1 Tax=Actinomadura alba TaxID=406431 RepID=A0ABR7LSK6_9ACTN|nr:HEAT repeat domain-containing protein [Actinomadura alba]MBC6467754.1 HEAT repeat domain-containing protein [Actinomadura alba]